MRDEHQLQVGRALQRLQRLKYAVYLDRFSLGWANGQQENTDNAGNYTAQAAQSGGGRLTEVGGNGSVHTLSKS